MTSQCAYARVRKHGRLLSFPADAPDIRMRPWNESMESLSRWQRYHNNVALQTYNTLTLISPNLHRLEARISAYDLSDPILSGGASKKKMTVHRMTAREEKRPPIDDRKKMSTSCHQIVTCHFIAFLGFIPNCIGFHLPVLYTKSALLFIQF